MSAVFNNNNHINNNIIAGACPANLDHRLDHRISGLSPNLGSISVNNTYRPFSQSLQTVLNLQQSPPLIQDSNQYYQSILVQQHLQRLVQQQQQQQQQSQSQSQMNTTNINNDDMFLSSYASLFPELSVMSSKPQSGVPSCNQQQENLIGSMVPPTTGIMGGHQDPSVFPSNDAFFDMPHLESLMPTSADHVLSTSISNSGNSSDSGSSPSSSVWTPTPPPHPSSNNGQTFDQLNAMNAGINANTNVNGPSVPATTGAVSDSGTLPPAAIEPPSIAEFNPEFSSDWFSSLTPQAFYPSPSTPELASPSASDSDHSDIDESSGVKSPCAPPPPFIAGHQQQPFVEPKPALATLIATNDASNGIINNNNSNNSKKRGASEALDNENSSNSDSGAGTTTTTTTTTSNGHKRTKSNASDCSSTSATTSSGRTVRNNNNNNNNNGRPAPHPKAIPCKDPGCPQFFSRTYNMNQHYDAVHARLKFHQCPEPKCLKMFTRKHDMRRHMRSVHHMTVP